MHQLLPLCGEFIVMDLGSDDGTLEVLKEIEAHNPKVKVVYSTFYENDAAIFAKLANDLIAQCNYPNVLYYQADEIWHENLIELTKKELNQGWRDLSFWRVQLRYNFQVYKWFPYPVHRIAPKDKFNFVNDGMNSDRAFDAKMVSTWDMGQFRKWEDDYIAQPETLPLHEMILDVSLTGGFLENIPERRRMHMPFWGEDINDIHMPADEKSMRLTDWMKKQRENEQWDKTLTEFNIPSIMRYHLGKKEYVLRPELLETLKAGEGWR